MTTNKDAGREEFELSDEEVALILSAGMKCTERETKLALQELRDGSPDTIKIMAGIRAVIAADRAKRTPPDTVPRSELEAALTLAKCRHSDSVEAVRQHYEHRIAELQAKAVPDDALRAGLDAFYETENEGLQDRVCNAIRSAYLYAAPAPAASPVVPEPEGLTPKEAWWAGARAALGLPADTPRPAVAEAFIKTKEVSDENKAD